MPLLAYNLTVAPLPLAAGSPPPTLPASASAGARGPGMNVTGELKSLTSANFAALQVQVAAGLVQYEWSGFPEFNTFTLIVGSAQEDLSELPLAFYADAATGNDSNPGTATLPLKTFNAMWSKIPANYKASVDLHFAAGTYIPSGPYYTNGALNRAGDRVVKLLGSVADVYGPLVVDATSSFPQSLVALGLVTVPGEARGKFVRMTSGGATGSRAIITDNTVVGSDTTFELLLNFEFFGVAPGDTFVIEEPTAIFQCPSFAPPAFLSGQTFLNFKDILFNSENVAGPDSFVPLVVFPENSFAIFEAVVFDMGTDARFFYAPHKGHINFRFSATNPGSAGCGVYMKAPPGVFGGLFTDDKTIIIGSIVTDNVSIGLSQTSQLSLDAIDARSDIGSELSVDTNSTLFVNSGRITGQAVYIVNNCYAELGGFGGFGFPLSIEDSGPDFAFGAFDCSLAKLGGVIGSVGNARGVWVDGESVVQVNRLGGTTTVTGAVADVQVGNVKKAYAALPYSEVDGSGPTLNRVS